MGRIKRRILCKNCPVLNTKVKEEGEKFRVEYIVLDTKERYLICDDESVSCDEVMKDRYKFISTYVPKFGKFEIEEFVGYFMQEAIYITKDISNLFNMELLCDDSPFNITRVSSETIKKRLLQCFEVVKKENDVTYLKFKWEAIS